MTTFRELAPRRTQIKASLAALKDVQGNRDGIAHNESLAPHSPPGLLQRQPLLHRLTSFFAPGLDAKDAWATLRAYARSAEDHWDATQAGRGTRERVPFTSLEAGQVANLDLFKVEKALALARFGRTPAEVTEGLLTARGRVAGQVIAPRTLFWQRWAPVGPPSGKVILVSPGYMQTGRNFQEQAQLLTQQGHDVILMDHQWAGYSEGKRGEIDRGFGIARDVAAMASFAGERATSSYGEQGEVIVLGTSMGGGAGAMGAALLSAAGQLELEGATVPRALPLVLQGPYFQASSNLVNKAFDVAARIPLVRDTPVPPLGVPVLSRDPAASAKLSQHAILDDVIGRPQAFRASNEDLAHLQRLVDAGVRPEGKVYVIHSDRDPLADPSASAALVEKLGARARLHVVESPNHLHDESALEQRHILQGLAWLAG